MKKQPIKCEEIFANHLFDKKLISTICKELTQFNSKKKENPTLKWIKDLSRHYNKMNRMLGFF